MKFINFSWESYVKLRRNKEKKKEQISNLFGTGLYESNDGIEYCFLPTKKMEELEGNIKTYYDKIFVEDHEISLCNEIYYTSKIEGSNITFKRTQEIHNGLPIEHDNYFSEMMVLGGFNATKMLNLYGNKLNEEILIKVWRVLTDGCRDNQDICGDKYRIGNVGVGNHMGLNYLLLEETMENWINFYNSDNLNDHPFIKAALLHFSFEYIHPFCDGNGRMGRLLMINYLIGQGFDKLKAVSFSKSIAKNPNAYYSSFVESENSYIDCTPFIEYMLETYEDAFYDVLELEEEKEDINFD